MNEYEVGMGISRTSRSAIRATEYLGSRGWLDLADGDIDRYVDGILHRDSSELAEQLAQWRDRGYVVLRGAADIGTIDAFLEDVDYLVAHHRDYDLEAEVGGQQKLLGVFTSEEMEQPGVKYNCIHSASLAARRLTLSPSVIEFLGHVFGAAPALLQSLTFYRGSQQPIHIDYPYVRTQTLLAHLAASWIALEDVLPGSGPLQYWPGSHHIDTSGFFDWGGGSIVMETDSDKTPSDFANYLSGRVGSARISPEVFYPKKGDILVWHGNLMHGGTPIADDLLTRKSYVCHYTSISGYPELFRGGSLNDPSWARHENGGYVFRYPWHEHVAQLPSGWSSSVF